MLGHKAEVDKKKRAIENTGAAHGITGHTQRVGIVMYGGWSVDGYRELWKIILGSAAP